MKTLGHQAGLILSTEPSGLCFNLKIHLQPTRFMIEWYGTRDQVLFLSKAFISVFIAWCHLGSLEACVKHVGSTGVVAKSAIRQVGMGYRVAGHTFGVLVLSCVLVTIWWVLVGGELGEPEDDDENDSSAGADGDGGEGVCDGGGSGRG